MIIVDEAKVQKFLARKFDRKMSLKDFPNEIEEVKNYISGLIFSRTVYDLEPDYQKNYKALHVFYDLFAKFDFDELTHSQSLMERLAMIFLDLKMFPSALEVIDVLEKNFGQYGLPYVLRTKIAFLQKDPLAGLEAGEKALSFNDLSVYNKLYVYNVLTGFYSAIGEREKVIEYALKSCSEDISTASPDMQETLFKFQLEDYGNYLFALHPMKLTHKELLQAAEKYNDFFKGVKVYTNEKKYRHKKLRIGYISPDFRWHVVSFFSLSLFDNYDRNSFEVYCYMNSIEDDVSKQIKSRVDHWTNIRGINRADAAKIIRRDEIDILFELAGHTGGGILPILAYKPAPVQISGIGYFDTTGLKTIDYFLTDRYTTPTEEDQEYFSEKLLKMEHSHFCFVWHEDIVLNKPAPFMKNGYITFGSFNQFGKMNSEVLSAWSEIMRQVPNSILYIKIGSGRYGSDTFKKALSKKLIDAGIPIERARIETHEKKYTHRYQEMDITLDTFPYPGGGTSCDALYMGVPMITLVGDTHNSRFGYSFLMNIGLPELCAYSVEEYIQKAVELAKDPDRIRKYHQTIRLKMEQSPVMDRSIYISEIESKYQKIFFDYVNDTDEKKSKFLKNLDKKISKTKKDSDLIPLLLQKVSCSEPDFETLLKLGQLYARNEDISSQLHAKYWFKKALPMNDENPEVPAYLATVLQQTADYIESFEMFSEALRRMEKNPDKYDFDDDSLEKFFNNFAKMCSNIGENEKSTECHKKAFEHSTTLLKRADNFSSILYDQHFTLANSAEIFEKHHQFQTLFNDVKQFETFERDFSLIDGKLEGKIRIGYISPDFRQHVMFPFMFGIFSCHDRSKFEIYAYSLCSKKDEDYFTGLIESNVDKFTRLDRKKLSECARKIHDDHINILFDFSGHTSSGALPILAYKPAPVQISGVGYMATTGLDAVDFFITDETTDPPGMHDEFFSEKLLYMPSQFCYVGRNDLEPSKGAPCKNRNEIWFACFQRYCKINDDMLKAWKEILERVPNSRLLLKSMELGSVSVVEKFYNRLESLGFDLDRVMFEPATREYMQRMLDVDIMLDTFPYPGGGTTCDTLYMGVPVVTMYNERRNTRFAYSILKSIGLEELAVENVSDYVNRAVALANDVELLDMLHKNLRNMMQNSPIMQHKKFTRTLEEYYLAICELLSN